MTERIPQTVTLRVPLQAYLATDHVTPATGKTIAITVSKNGGAYGNPSGGATNAVEIASGSYYVDLSTTDTGTLGPLFVLGTASGVDNVVTIYDVVKATNGGLSALPDTAATTNAILLTSGTGTDQLSVTSGRVDIGKILGTASTGTAGYVGIDWGHVNAPTTTVGLTGTTISSSQVVASVSGAVGSVTGLTASNLDATISSRMATYTQPTGFFAATFPSGTMANTTNITAGTITTATNLTNAPTAGDFTATMKTSLNAATPASVVGSVGSIAAGGISSSSFAAGAITAAVTDSTFDAAIASATFVNPMTEAYATVGGSLSLAKFAYGMNQFFSEFSVASTTLTVKGRDQATTKATYTLNSATTPTALTQAS